MKNGKMRIPVMVSSLLSALLSAVVGITCLIRGNVGETLLSWMGVLLLFGGLSQLACVTFMQKTPFAIHPLATKGLLTTAVGGLIIFQGLINPSLLEFLVSMLVMLCGIQLLSTANILRGSPVKGRILLYLLSVLEIAVGVIGFLRRDLLGLPVSTVTGVSLILEGLMIVYVWSLMDRYLKTGRPEKSGDVTVADKPAKNEHHKDAAPAPAPEKSPEAAAKPAADTVVCPEPVKSEAAPAAVVDDDADKPDEVEGLPMFPFGKEKNAEKKPARNLEQIKDDLPKMPGAEE